MHLEPAERRMVKLSTAASMFEVSERKLREAVKAGRIPYIEPYGAYLVRPDDVEAFLIEKSRESAR